MLSTSFGARNVCTKCLRLLCSHPRNWLQSRLHSLLKCRVIRVALLRRVCAVKGVSVVGIQRETLCQPLGQIRVGDEMPAVNDQIRIAGIKLGHGVVTCETACCDELYAALGEDLAEVVERVVLGFDGRFGLDAVFGRCVGREGVELLLLI